jgi:hypothetical protein
MNGRVKVLFDYDSGEPGQMEVETMWAIPTAEGFQLDNIPFFVRDLAVGDIISATAGPDGRLRFEGLVQPSGHSTLRLWFAKGREGDVVSIRHQLRELGCSSELSDLPRLVAVDVPPAVSLDKIRTVLDEYESSGLLEYEESCLGT